MKKTDMTYALFFLATNIKPTFFLYKKYKEETTFINAIWLLSPLP